MMNDMRIALTYLLEQTSQAHGEYETTLLNGVYDLNWPRWYAHWALEHGLDELLNSSLSVEDLGELLDAINQQHQFHSQGLSWAQFTAYHLAKIYANQRG